MKRFSGCRWEKSSPGVPHSVPHYGTQGRLTSKKSSPAHSKSWLLHTDSQAHMVPREVQQKWEGLGQSWLCSYPKCKSVSSHYLSCSPPGSRATILPRLLLSSVTFYNSSPMTTLVHPSSGIKTAVGLGSSCLLWT